MIQLNKISVIFSRGTALEKNALQNINLTINRGDFISVIGGNGAGKSTLINLLAGEFYPDQGQILFDDIDISRMNPINRSRFISRVFQDPKSGICEELSIEENLALASKRGKRRGLKRGCNSAKRSQFRSLLAKTGLGLENRLQDKVGMLSGGQRQALALLMATLQPSKILLLDEHTAALDPKMEQIILTLTNKIITEHQLTAIMITHCMSQAIDIGNRLLMMRQGEIIQDVCGSNKMNLNTNTLLDFFM